MRQGEQFLHDPDEALLGEVRAQYGDQWEITRDGDLLRAKHRTETPDARREQATLMFTEITAHYPEELSSRLYVQQELRREYRARGTTFGEAAVPYRDQWRVQRLELEGGCQWLAQRIADPDTTILAETLEELDSALEEQTQRTGSS